jgi:hypothetical protein
MVPGMSKITARGGWLHWRDDTAYAGEGRVRISSISAVYRGTGDPSCTINTESGASWLIENVTVDEVMAYIRAEDDPDKVAIITEQAAHIDELERQIEALRAADAE